jgi:PRC-barrel domain
MILPNTRLARSPTLMIDSNGTVTGAIIGVGGFLGVGQKDVVIPFKELKVSTRDGKDWLVLNRTKDELLKLAPRASIGVKEAIFADGLLPRPNTHELDAGRVQERN